MAFWDRFAFRVYASFLEGYPDGLLIAEEVLSHAYGCGKLNVRRLNDLSVLLCILTCGQHQPLHNVALLEHHRRSSMNVSKALLVSVPSLPTALVGTCVRGNSDQRKIGFESMFTLYRAPFFRFMTRLYLPPDAKWPLFVAQTERWLWRVWCGMTAPQLATVHNDFLRLLYGDVRRQVAAPAIATCLPSPAPVWFQELDADEQRLIGTALRELNHDERWLLYASLFAELNVAQLGDVAKPSQAVHATAQSLRGIWLKLLDRW